MVSKDMIRRYEKSFFLYMLQFRNQDKKNYEVIYPPPDQHNVFLSTIRNVSDIIKTHFKNQLSVINKLLVHYLM